MQRAANVKSRVAEVTKIEASMINQEVVNDTRSKTSESQQEVQPRSSTEGQVVTTSEQAAVQVSSTSQTSPHLRSSPARLVYNPRLRANRGKQDG